MIVNIVLGSHEKLSFSTYIQVENQVKLIEGASISINCSFLRSGLQKFQSCLNLNILS